ncbi:hypothetical protein BC939DRAFT_476842 [Gamsiella multidivaricata]|uniref:uncharacterized protein n=1 Tax=Gamsiella multidivaricata TaxID=101098 RepID=UPI00221FE9A6|nr:uncharacterized protein BC939DRAFT_476842 [Gamsiella multidivaricata]KAG0354053.1 hypothetical protein BGZ54_001873 [Gamsiella multidivaricata]KAI7824039.1 hypothetical protein BC939DRAFT_476842 [Gamsiella multidivaricata]
MNPSNGIPETNVEDMSNAELFQYLFKAELGSDLPAAFADVLFTDTASASPAPSPSSSLYSSDPSVHSPLSPMDSSPTTSSLSFHSPPSYQETDIDIDTPQLQQEQQQQVQPLLQLQNVSLYPTLLPSTSFSFRQISPDMPPSMPAQSTTADPTGPEDQFLSLAHTATAAASAASSTQMSFWMQRFQQLQQLEQMHYQQQQQLLASPLFAADSPFNLSSLNIATSAAAGLQSSSASERSASPSLPPSKTSSSGLPTVKPEKDVIYPSPPMKDDMYMDSDSDDGSNQGGAASPDPLKPSPSELKKMTSKERRQLRNKLSARNFRVRRKEYISSLENQVKEARKEATELQKKLAQSEMNYQILRQELETARLSQTLFNDGRNMSREHANLLASLLNPNTESFPTTSSSDSILSTAQQQQQQKELMDSIHHNNMTILNNPLTVTQPQASSALPESTLSTSQGSLQPFVAFDGNWELIVNRAEMIVDPALDPKDEQSKAAVYEDLLARYEAAKYESEVDEQMRTELQAYHEQKLAQTYIVMPKDEVALLAASKAGQDTLLLQTMVYMMMIQLTRSLFEAATLSKAQLVNMYQNVDPSLRSKMGQEQQERRACKFAEWREAWICKYWPSFYNNRQRVCELLKNGLCPAANSPVEVDVDEAVRQMEEGVKDKTVEPQMTPFCVWLRSCIASWLRCPEQVAKEEREALLRESRKSLEVID